ncbi:hypothetical protein LCGC14_1801290 [marine sediment metagenome]|uniref:Thymidylate synthase (FAD) n=1 Tax=marine sediment metagenome TaxID=412755 RepID=A0A0F9GPF8_9ZZZZ
MKIKTEPEVYIIGRPSFDYGNASIFLERNGLSNHMLEEMSGTDADNICEMSTRLCYLAFEKGRDSKAFFENIFEMEHTSTIEHANWTLIIAGVSRSFTHELVRHRAGFSYSQLSQRYVDESDVAFVMPPLIQDLGKDAQFYWEFNMKEALENYKTQIIVNIRHLKDSGLNKTERRKRAREAARSVLPNATETYIAVTANARAWNWFIKLRGGAGADREMQKVAAAVYEVLKHESEFLI